MVAENIFEGAEGMKKNLNIFVDPKTHRNLDLRIDKEVKNEIISGELYNTKNTYPIIRGIPRFVHESLYRDYLHGFKDNQTARSFGNKWREERSKNFGFMKQDVQYLKEQFMAVLGCDTLSQMKKVLKSAKRALNAGCGVAWSEYLFNYNAGTERHCIDISLSVETAYNRTKDFGNVVVSHSSIFEMPYENETFDLIYSIGVIHHTPDPQKAFKSLVRKLAPNGLIGCYIYNRKPFLREISDREIRNITTKMNYDECMNFSKKMSKLGKAFSKISQTLVVEENIDLLDIKKGRYNLHKFIYDHFLKIWFNPNQDMAYANLVNQDWYHPHYASHHTKDEILSWFRNEGIEKIKIIQPKGWENSGYFVSGRKG